MDMATRQVVSHEQLLKDFARRFNLTVEAAVNVYGSYLTERKLDFVNQCLSPIERKDFLTSLGIPGSAEREATNNLLKVMYCKPRTTEQVLHEPLFSDACLRSFMKSKGDWRWTDGRRESMEYYCALYLRGYDTIYACYPPNFDAAVTHLRRNNPGGPPKPLPAAMRGIPPTVHRYGGPINNQALLQDSTPPVFDSNGQQISHPWKSDVQIHLDHLNYKDCPPSTSQVAGTGQGQAPPQPPPSRPAAAASAAAAPAAAAGAEARQPPAASPEPGELEIVIDSPPPPAQPVDERARIPPPLQAAASAFQRLPPSVSADSAATVTRRGRGRGRVRRGAARQQPYQRPREGDQQVPFQYLAPVEDNECDGASNGPAE